MRKFYALLLALAMVTAACSGDSTDTTETADEPTATSAATETTDPPTATTEGSTETTTAPSDNGGTPSGDPIKIGAILGISGRFAFVGAPQQNALLLAQEEMNAAGGIAGRPVEFIIYDDEVDETKTVPLTNRLIGEDGVVAIIGPSITIPALAMAPIVEGTPIPNITLTSRPIWEQDNLAYVFQTTPREEVEVLSLLSFIKDDLGTTEIGVLYDAQPYGTGNLAHIENLAPGLGLNVIATESIENGDTNAVPQLERLRDAGVETLIVWVGDPAASSTAKGAEQIGWDVNMIGSSAIAGPTFPELAEGAGEGVYSDGAYNFDDPPPNQAGFLADYQAMFESFPTQFAAFAYDAAYAFKYAIEQAGGDTSPDAIRQGLLDMAPYEGVTAVYDFTDDDHNGFGLNPLFYIVQVQDGAYRVVTKTGS